MLLLEEISVKVKKGPNLVMVLELVVDVACRVFPTLSEASIVNVTAPLKSKILTVYCAFHELPELL